MISFKMKEVQRIISNGLVYLDYLKEEVIDGCLVSGKIKKISGCLIRFIK